MNFAHAVNEMLKGNAVRRPAWDKMARLTIENKQFVSYRADYLKNEIKTVNPDPTHWTDSSKTDWEVFIKSDPNKEKAIELRKQAENLVKQAEDLERSL